MRKVWKYNLSVSVGNQSVEIPEVASLVHIGADVNKEGTVGLWFVVDTDAPTSTRVFRIFATGEEIPENDYGYRGTSIHPTSDIQYVFHVFELVDGS